MVPAGDAEMLPCANFSQAPGKLGTQDCAFCGASAWMIENMIFKKQQRLETNVGEERPPWLAGAAPRKGLLPVSTAGLPSFPSSTLQSHEEGLGTIRDFKQY